MHQKGRDYSDCSKDEVAAVFTAARHDADVSVNELERIIASGNYSPKKTEQKLLSNLESQTAMK